MGAAPARKEKVCSSGRSLMEVKIHPRVRGYLQELPEKERGKIKRRLRDLGSDPYKARSGLDIKKLRGKKHDMYRLRVGEHRFEYFVEEKTVWIDEAFRRGRGYRER